MAPIEHPAPPVFRCPVCEEPLLRQERSYRCTNGHLFDIAREGYVNLLLAQHRNSKGPGYNKEMIAGRRDFFDAGHYQQLADGVAHVIAVYLPESGDRVVVDAGCGEGFSLRRLRRLLGERGQDPDTVLCGMDISKHGVRVAAKRDPAGLYAVADTFRMPVIDERVDVLLTHFSPVSAAEFRRVVKPGGVVLVGCPAEDHLFAVGCPAEDHLFAFKELIYDSPAQHEPTAALAEEDGFELITVHRIRYPLRLRGPGQVANLLLMTPFSWSVGDETRIKLAELDELDTEVDVVVHAYRRVPTEHPSEASAGEPTGWRQGSHWRSTPSANRSRS